MVDEDFHKRAGVGSVVRCDCGEPGCPHEVPAPALFVKVTEATGAVDYTPWDGVCLFTPKAGEAGGQLTLQDMIPPEAKGAAHGRFRITIEFTPAGPEAGK